jgi:translocation and assembly module TamB
MARGWQTWSIRIGAGAASLVAVLALGLWFLTATSPGHMLLTRLIAGLSGGRVTIHNLSGDVFGGLAADRVDIADKNGPWLSIDKLDLEWRGLALLSNHAEIAALKADRIVLQRLPVSSGKASESEFRVDIAKLDVGRIEIGQAAFGRAGVLRASGSLYYVSRRDASAHLDIDRLDGSGRYRIDLSVEGGRLRGSARLDEQGEGLVGSFAGLPDIGPVQATLDASVDGDRNAVALRLTAGGLRAEARGDIDLTAEGLHGVFSLDAPAMRPRQDLFWAALHGDGTIDGSFARPTAKATLRVDALSASGIAADAVEADLVGGGGDITLTGAVRGLRLPGKRDAFAAAPLRLSAHLRLGKGPKPLQVTVDHPLLALRGDLSLDKTTSGTLTLDLPQLQPLAAMAGFALDGRARLTADIRQTGTNSDAKLSGEIAASGATPLARLVGRAALTAKVERHRGDTDIEATLQSANLRVTLIGGSKAARQDFRAHVEVSDLAKLSPALVGRFAVDAHLSGEADALKLTADGKGQLAPKGWRAEFVAMTIRLDHLPAQPAGEIQVTGNFAAAPVALAVELSAQHLVLKRAAWKSLSGQGSFTLSAKPQGQLSVAIGNLADLAPFAPALSGSADARVTLTAQDGKSRAAIEARLHRFATGSVTIPEADLSGRIDDPLAAPQLDLALRVPQFASGAISGSTTAKLSGSTDALDAALAAQLATDAGPVTLEAHSRIDAIRKTLAISAFKSVWNGKTVTLRTPASVALSDGEAEIDAALIGDAATALTIRGKVPLDDSHAFDLRLFGKTNLTGWTALLSSSGRSLRGAVTLDATLRGRRQQPQAFGTATLQGGNYRDFIAGISLTDIEATLVAEGDSIKLERFSAKAQGGSLAGSGRIGLAGDMPVALSFAAKNARPFSRDDLTVALDGEVALQGALKGNLTVTGALQIAKGEIRIPARLPANVAVLDVRRRHEKTPPRTQPGRIVLALTVSSPGQLFIRGRGLNAELAGTLKIGGTSGAPQITGTLNMRRGDFSLAGTTLDFQSGNIGFAGTGAAGKLDPTLDFVAQTAANGVTATLKIAGTAATPKVELSSAPSLPQDEILAQLLFQKSVQQLSPVQLVQIAQSLAALSGVGPGIDPVGMVRDRLGLDRFTLGSAAGANGAAPSTTVEAGKYIFRNVYVGATQDLAGGTRAQVQVDLGRHVKLRASVNAASGSAVPSTQAEDKGDTVGLSYQFDY